jgi:hypothetical protein
MNFSNSQYAIQYEISMYIFKALSNENIYYLKKFKDKNMLYVKAIQGKTASAFYFDRFISSLK